MLTLTVTIKGKNFSDLELALDEVKTRVEQEYLVGYDSNSRGDYTFDISGEEEDGED